MITRPVSTPYFHYYFRPLSRDFMHAPYDCGFSLTLYHENLLLVEHYTNDFQIMHQALFTMPLQLKLDFLALADTYKPLLEKAGSRLYMPDDQQPRFLTRFGVDQLDLICCEDLLQLIQRPFRDDGGRRARLLYAFFEDVAELLTPYGVDLRLSDYYLHESMMPLQQTAPFNPHQPTAAYTTGQVQTNAYNTGAYNTGSFDGTGAANF